MVGGIACLASQTVECRFHLLIPWDGRKGIGLFGKEGVREFFLCMQWLGHCKQGEESEEGYEERRFVMHVMKSSSLMGVM